MASEIFIDLDGVNAYIKKLESLITKIENSSGRINQHMIELKTTAWEGNAAQAFIDYQELIRLTLSDNETRIYFIKNQLKETHKIFSEVEGHAKRLNKF